jgi:hypothetical protein
MRAENLKNAVVGSIFSSKRHATTAKTRVTIMGQQINKIEKRRRRKAYLERCAERAKAAAKKK